MLAEHLKVIVMTQRSVFFLLFQLLSIHMLILIFVIILFCRDYLNIFEDIFVLIKKTCIVASMARDRSLSLRNCCVNRCSNLHENGCI